MNLYNMLRAYPSCQTAIAYTEGIICTSSDGEETSWEMLVRSGATLDEILSDIQSVLEGETECRAQEVLSQTRTLDYRRYLAGKMGMM